MLNLCRMRVVYKLCFICNWLKVWLDALKIIKFRHKTLLTDTTQWCEVEWNQFRSYIVCFNIFQPYIALHCIDFAMTWITRQYHFRKMIEFYIKYARLEKHLLDVKININSLKCFVSVSFWTYNFDIHCSPFTKIVR